MLKTYKVVFDTYPYKCNSELLTNALNGDTTIFSKCLAMTVATVGYKDPEAYEVMRLISSVLESDYRKNQTSFMSKHSDSFDDISQCPMTAIESLFFLDRHYLLGDIKVTFTKVFSIIVNLIFFKIFI